MAQRYEIVEGPSKWDLMMSLFDRENEREPIEFRVMQGGIKRSVYVVTIEIGKLVTGAKNDWTFKGCTGGRGIPVRGLFSTRTRTGWIEIQE
jgi:hypothetical protein